MTTCFNNTTEMQNVDDYGVAMKQMTDLVWGQGYYISGSTVYTSNKVVEYSVQTYAGNKLGILSSGKSKVADGNEHFYVEGNCLIDKATGTVLCAANTAVMPAGVKAIGRNAFYRFAGTSIAIPSTVTSIGEDAFYKSAITSITIPGSVTEIAEFAFHYCKDLGRVVLQSGVKIIGLDAFGGDPASTNGELTIYIPKTVSSIGEYALEDWKMLNIYYEGTKQEWESIEKGELWAAGVGNINLNYEQAIPTE